MVRDIIPMVRHDYRTIEGPAGVLVGGSSLGGLAALYAHHRRPDVFGGALAMSPSLWVGRGALLSYIEREPRPWTSKIYLDTGAGEGGGKMATSVERLDKIFQKRGYGEGQAPGPHRQARRAQRAKLAATSARGAALLLPRWRLEQPPPGRGHFVPLERAAGGAPARLRTTVASAIKVTRYGRHCTSA